MANIQTYKEVIGLIESICDSHLAVKQFTVGQLSDADIESAEHPFQRFPMVHLIPATSSLDRYGKMVLGFDMIVGDIAKDNEEDLQINTHNSTLMIMQDLLSKIILTDWTEVDINLETPISIEPFQERLNNNLTGWTATLNIEVKSPFNLCDAAFV